MEFLEESQQKLFEELKERALKEGAYTHDEWKSVVDEVVQEHEEFGELDDEGIENLKSTLNGRYSEFENEIPTA